MKKLILLVVFLAFGTSASTTYTKEQLNDMDQSGQYPEQESPVTKGIESVGFNKCKNDTGSIYNQVLGNYPAKEVVDSDVLYVVKIWTNDGAIMVSCSKPDGKKVITQSSYK